MRPWHVLLATLAGWANQDTITCTLALLNPDDLFPAWRYIDMMEQQGEINREEAQRWKEGIYGLMQLWGLEADDLVMPND